MGIAAGPTAGVLLTRRTAHLRQHSGQVSFPGGRIDPLDASPEAAAVREAQEEVGLDPSHAEILGRLRDYATGTGYRITPVLALLSPGYATQASAHEVADIFQLPLAVLLATLGGSITLIAMRKFWVLFSKTPAYYPSMQQRVLLGAGGVALVVIGAIAMRGVRHEAGHVADQNIGQLLANLPPGYAVKHGPVDYNPLTGTATLHDV